MNTLSLLHDSTRKGLRFRPGSASRWLAACLVFTTGSALAGPRHGEGWFWDTAHVVSSTPIYEEYNEPRQECWSEEVGYRYEGERERSYAGAILGGIAGGVLGHQIGKGTGKTVATAAGAAAGAIIGDSLDNGGRIHSARRKPVYEAHCRTVEQWSRRITGWDVVYRYHGQEYQSVLPYRPGPTVRVRVHVELDDES